MAQSTTNLGKIHVFPSETLYNQFKDIIADNDLALLRDDGAYIVAALLKQNGYVKFSNGLILQWGVKTSLTDSWTYYPIPFTSTVYGILGQQTAARVTAHAYFDDVDLIKFHYKVTQYDTYPTFQTEAAGWFLAYGK